MIDEFCHTRRINSFGFFAALPTIPKPKAFFIFPIVLVHLRALSKKTKRGVPDVCLNRLKFAILCMKDLDLPPEIGKRMNDLLVAIESEDRREPGEQTSMVKADIHGKSRFLGPRRCEA